MAESDCRDTRGRGTNLQLEMRIAAGQTIRAPKDVAEIFLLAEGEDEQSVMGGGSIMVEIV